MTKFQKFIQKLRKENAVEEFADQVGTSKNYVNKRLYGAYRTPKGPLWRGLLSAAKGQLSDQDICDHFIHNPKVIEREGA